MLIKPQGAWIFVFCEFCVLQRADPSSREVLPCVCVIEWVQAQQKPSKPTNIR